MPKRVDGNQSLIVASLRKIPHLSVFDAHELGGGFPDIVVGYKRRNWLFEIKDPKQPPSKRKLTPAELEFRNSWAGQVNTVESFLEIWCIINNTTIR